MHFSARDFLSNSLKINSCAKSAWYARCQHSYNICKDFLSHNSGMKNLNFTKKYTPFPNNRPQGAKMGVSVFCLLRAYCSAHFDEFLYARL
jgi:hypothetical protein